MTTFYSQINEGDLLDCRDLDKFNLEDGYSIVPCVHKGWKNAEKRLLVIVESVDSLDIKNGSMLSGDTVDNTSRRDKFSTHNPMRSVFSALLDKAVSMLRPYGEDVAGQFSFGIANFNAKKIRQLPVHDQAGHFPKFTNRVLAIINRLKPTHVLVCGDTASHQLLQVLDSPDGTPKHLVAPQVAENSLFKRGWVFERSYKGHSFLMCPTLDIESLYNVRDTNLDEDGDDNEAGDSDRFAAGDLLFFVARNICNMLAGRMLHDLSSVKPKPVYIDTIEKFNGVMEKVQAADIVACDTETNNLSSNHNKLIYIQFAVSSLRGYVIPVMHPKTPFDGAEIKYILKELRQFFLSKKKKVIVFINGMFDLRVLRTQASMPLIPYHKIHEITAGEQSLDENLGLFGRLKFYYMGKYEKASYQNLRAIFCYYGNDLYWRMAFSKEDRTQVALYEPDDPRVLDYCALDVQSLFAMTEAQRARAHHMYVKPDKASSLVRYDKYFERHLHHQMSNTVQGISHMEQYGTHVDVEYLLYMMSKKSPLIGVIKETTKELLAMPSTQTANTKLLKKSGKPSVSLFGDTVDMDIFTPSKKEHTETLFFDTLKLKVISYTKTGQRAIDKNFMAAYKDTIPEVALFETITKGSKLLSTYVKGWYKKMVEGLDSRVDDCLRASYGFFTIVSGRLNSFDPSLQQIPSRGKLAYYIKRMFTPPPGCLAVKDDYSAHEVRVWSIISGDQKVAAAFKAGLKLRRKLIKAAINDTGLLEEIRKELKQKGDIHIQNVFRFFGKWVEKSDKLREAVKAIIFGILYGKGTKTLARDVKKTPEEAQELIDKLFNEFVQGAKWLTDAVDLVKKYGHVVSPIGRVRNVWRIYTGKKGVIAAAARRAQNSPIQGFASEIGGAGSFQTLVACYEFLKQIEWDVRANLPQYNRAVHDSALYSVPYAFVLPFIHIRQYMATNGITNWYKEIFGVEFTVEPEIELEVFASEDQSYKWDWEIPHLLTNIYNALQDQVKLGQLPAKDLDATWELILKPWKSKSLRALLCEQYPLLNVQGLESNILEAVRSFKIPEPKEAKK